ncbi:hypothetical protein Tco_0262916, partial [Tanacetum coccineum]
VVKEEVVPTNVVEEAPSKNQENVVAPAALIVHKSSMPSNLLDRYYGFIKDSEGQYLRDHDELDT